MKKGILTSLGLAAVLTLGLATVNEITSKEVNAAEGTWTLVTDVTNLSVGTDIVITTKDYTADFALGTTQNTNNRKGVNVSISGNNVTFGNDVQILTLEEGNQEGTFALSTGTGYLYCASTSDKNYLRTQDTVDDKASWSITIQDGNASIVSKANVERNIMSFTATKGQNDTYTYAFSCYKAVQNSEIAIYAYERNVTDLFTKYYHGGSYIKETVLNVNGIAQEEIKEYFHAGAQAKYRQTVYSNGQLVMKSSTTKVDNWNSIVNTSKYKDNNNGGVDHYKNENYDYSVSGTVNGENRSSVENWFVTLYDFKGSSPTGWTYDDGVYSFDLSTSESMTKWAREFVAPMWLATDAARNYVTFDKLTVEEVSETLLMKLYVKSGNSGHLEEGANLVFSQATISRNHTGGTATCIVKANCTICGEDYGTEAEHNYADELSDLGSTHAHKCTTSGCTATDTPVPHSYPNGTCECGAVQMTSTDVSMDIFANQGVLSGTSISWTSENVTFTNNKHNSTTNIRTSDSNHYRIYKNSEIVISTTATKITKIVFTCTSADYASKLKSSIGSDATVSGSVVTVTCNTNEYKFVNSVDQTRINKVVVTVQ